FMLTPDVYQMKDNSMSSNPDTKAYLSHDVFTYISYALNPEKNEDTAHYNIHEVKEGDTIFYSKGYMVFNGVTKDPPGNKFNLPAFDGITLQANLTVTGRDSLKYAARPIIQIDSFGATSIEDTIYAQNLFVKFAGATNDKKIKIAVKESDNVIDFVTIKAYVFPYINLVWVGLIIMAAGFIVSMRKRASLSKVTGAIALSFVVAALFYMFLLGG
ncbi:MAG: hypothetical protein M3Z01_02935, partial [Thermoproteota archaeon]|nr:hypothetical protein [Thermoproteota archaeon]